MTVRARMRSRRACEYPLCDRPHRANGLCNAHNEQRRRGKELTPLLALPKYALTYVAYWHDELGPGEGVLKVGRAWKWSRIEEMQRSGAHVIVAHPGTDASWEREALKEMDRLFEPAFAAADEASGILWRGRGWTECFRVDERDLYMAFRMCIRAFARGNDEGVNPDDGHRPKWNREQWLRHKLRQVADHLAATAVAPDTVGDDGRPDEDGGQPGQGAPGRDADRIDAHPAPGRADDRPRPAGDAPTHARGDGIPVPAPGRPVVVDRAAAGARRCAGGAPGASCRRVEPGFLHGYRGRERKSARAGERTQACVGPDRRRGTTDGRQLGRMGSTGSHTAGTTRATSRTESTSAGMPGSPARLPRVLRSLRHPGSVPEVVARPGAVRGAAGDVRGAAGRSVR